MKCVICKGNILPQPLSGWDQGHNAEPVKKGRCCEACNILIVVPARMKHMQAALWQKPIHKQDDGEESQ